MNDLRLCICAGRQPHKREPYATQTKTKTKKGKPPHQHRFSEGHSPQESNLGH